MRRTKTRAWSKLRKSLSLIMIRDFQLHATHCKKGMSSSDIPHFWITVGKETVFDYPRCEVDLVRRGEVRWKNDMSLFSQLIRDYIDTPAEKLMEKYWPQDQYGLMDILKACDRRIGQRRLRNLHEHLISQKARDIVERRKLKNSTYSKK